MYIYIYIYIYIYTYITCDYVFGWAGPPNDWFRHIKGLNVVILYKHIAYLRTHIVARPSY